MYDKHNKNLLEYYVLMQLFALLFLLSAHIFNVYF